MSSGTGWPGEMTPGENATGAIVPGPRRRQLMLELARDVLGDDREVPELLVTALQQLIDKINGQPEPAQPVDWAAVVQENVQLRRNFF